MLVDFFHSIVVSEHKFVHLEKYDYKKNLQTYTSKLANNVRRLVLRHQVF